ncbi:MAG: hypothetical protein MZV70_19565 [Desulfobacterales bacterium]|nr:hypothetical protein [Desulfobacterales bacterium]
MASPTRRRLIELLRDGPRTTGDLCGCFRTTRFATMKHLGRAGASRDCDRAPGGAGAVERPERRAASRGRGALAGAAAGGPPAPGELRPACPGRPDRAAAGRPRLHRSVRRRPTLAGLRRADAEHRRVVGRAAPPFRPGHQPGPRAAARRPIRRGVGPSPGGASGRRHRHQAGRATGADRRGRREGGGRAGYPARGARRRNASPRGVDDRGGRGGGGDAGRRALDDLFKARAESVRRRGDPVGCGVVIGTPDRRPSRRPRSHFASTSLQCMEPYRRTT